MKEKKLFYKKAIEIPMYGGIFLIIFSNDISQIRKTVNCSDKIDGLYAFTFHNFLHKGRETFCVCLNFWAESRITLGTIMHEVSHAANRLMSSRGIDPSFDNDESESYIKGWMADEIEKFMVKCNLIK
jgi:hypothetical protein